MQIIKNEICRTCLIESTEKNSLFDNKTIDGKLISLSSMINLCTNVKVKNNIKANLSRDTLRFNFFVE